MKLQSRSASPTTTTVPTITVSRQVSPFAPLHLTLRKQTSQLQLIYLSPSGLEYARVPSPHSAASESLSPSRQSGPNDSQSHEIVSFSLLPKRTFAFCFPFSYLFIHSFTHLISFPCFAFTLPSLLCSVLCVCVCVCSLISILRFLIYLFLVENNFL